MSERRLEVAVWWPNEGYGMGRAVADEAEAQAYAERLRSMGYGETSKSEIHMVETVRTVKRIDFKEKR